MIQLQQLYNQYSQASMPIDEAISKGFLTVNTGRNGHEYVWYYDGQEEWCYDCTEKKLAEDKEIEEQLM